MANLITVSRLPLLLVIVLLLYSPWPLAHAICVPLLVILVLMDSLDGIVARRRHEVSVLGSVLDIMVDRSVELVLWVVYAHLGLVPVAIPLLFIIRGVVVDTLRNSRVGEGVAPFKTLATPWGRFLVGSPVMRTGYAVVKLLAFTGLAATLAVMGSRGADSSLAVALQGISVAMSWLATAVCLVRGAPVVIEAAGKLTWREPR
ncbi:MAG: CDP-alcohol phosphatidyltransferase family protein [Anaerolineae bacterium]|jgi:CDP-diacylglycerol--glycerol-3-phosphate 3-phosphatidyltransferase